MQEEAAGSVFWHPHGWTLWRAVEELRPPAARQRRLRPGQDAAALRPRVLGALGALGEIPRNMFTLEAEERHTRAQADELPRPRPDLQPAAPQLPRPAPAAGRVRFLSPQRAVGCAPRYYAGASVYPGRCAHLPHAPADHGRERRVLRPADEGVQGLRLRGRAGEVPDRPPVRAGEDAVWDQAEAALWEAVRAAGLECSLNPGEGAFYGPKLEFVLRDAIGRDWQCGTLQVDFVLPERLDANYIGPDGAKHRPVMLHRAIFGSLERFIGMLIEHYAGRLPGWPPRRCRLWSRRSPTKPIGYAHELVERLRAAGVRAEADARADKIGYKVREHSLRKVPLLLAVGAREQGRPHGEPAAARRHGADRPVA